MNRMPAIQTKDQLFLIEDYSTFMQALSLGHEVVIDNGMTKIKLSMDEDYHIKGLNLNFPNLPPYNYDEEMTLHNILMGIIPQLKNQKPIEFPNTFKNRWEEIKKQTLDEVAMNRISKQF